MESLNSSKYSFETSYKSPSENAMYNNDNSMINLYGKSVAKSIKQYEKELREYQQQNVDLKFQVHDMKQLIQESCRIDPKLISLFSKLNQKYAIHDIISNENSHQALSQQDTQETLQLPKIMHDAMTAISPSFCQQSNASEESMSQFTIVDSTTLGFSQEPVPRDDKFLKLLHAANLLQTHLKIIVDYYIKMLEQNKSSTTFNSLNTCSFDREESYGDRSFQIEMPNFDSLNLILEEASDIIQDSFSYANQYIDSNKTPCDVNQHNEYQVQQIDVDTDNNQKDYVSQINFWKQQVISLNQDNKDLYALMTQVKMSSEEKMAQCNSQEAIRNGDALTKSMIEDVDHRWKLKTSALINQYEQRISELLQEMQNFEHINKKLSEDLQFNIAAQNKLENDIQVGQENVLKINPDNHKTSYKYLNMNRENKSLKNKIAVLEMYISRNDKAKVESVHDSKVVVPTCDDLKSLQQISISTDQDGSVDSNISASHGTPKAKSLTEFSISSPPNEDSSEEPSEIAVQKMVKSNSYNNPKIANENNLKIVKNKHNMTWPSKDLSSQLVNFKCCPCFTTEESSLHDVEVLIINATCYENFTKHYSEIRNLTIKQNKPLSAFSLSLMKYMAKCELALYAQPIWRGEFKSLVSYIKSQVIEENLKLKETISEITDKLRKSKARKNNLERGIMKQIGHTNKLLSNVHIS
ncbi:unnamed protein product [Gordionus sp. m RMFG-2023]